MQKRSFIALNCEKDWRRGLMLGLSVDDNGLVIKDSASVSRGVYYSAAFDSGENDFEWGRLIIEAAIPEDTLFKIYVYASNFRQLDGEEELDTFLKDPYVSPVVKASRLDQIYNESYAGTRDLLLRSRGRYIWLKFELVSTGEIKPRIYGVRLEYEGDHMADYLPAIYRKGEKDSFTKRFLSIFNSMVLDLEEAIYSVSKRFDYERADGDMLRYIASWICIDIEGLDDEGIRRAIAQAIREYQFAQTPDGIKKLIKRWTGREPIILEHFSLDEVLHRGKDKALYTKLYGTKPYKFFVMLDEKTFKSRRESDSFMERLKKVLPAHVDAELILLNNCIYLDWHTYLGINSAIGSYTPLMINESTAIHYDTIIGGELN